MAEAKWREVKSFYMQVLKGRWFMIFASLLIMSVNGTSYMFSLYSGEIKSSLGYDQTTLNTVSFFKDLGGSLGVTAGLIYEVVPPWVVLSLGGVMNFVGYFMIWVLVTGRTGKPRLWLMCLYMCLATNAASYPNTAALVTSVHNFPESRGGVIGLLKGLIGLSGATMTQMYHAFYGNDSTSLILLIAWLPSIVPFIFLRTIRVIKASRQENELRVFYNFLYISLGLAGFIMIVIIIQNKFSFSRGEYIGSAAFVFVLLLLPLAIVIKQESSIQKSKRPAVNGFNELNVVAENPPQIETRPQKWNWKLNPISFVAGVFNQPKRGDDYTILQAIFSIDMLIILVSTTCGVGGALAALDNLGQIADSFGYKKRNMTTFNSLVSIWNFLGRVLSGFVSEVVLTKHKLPRPLLLTLVILLSCVGHILIAFGVPNSLYFSSIIIGFCLGAQLPLVSSIISEIFGLKHFSTLYSVGSVSSPIGSYIFNIKVAGRLYDKEALKQMEALGLKRQAGEELTCSGVKCFRTAFVIITAAAFFGFLVSIVLVFRTRKFYTSDIYKKFRQEVEEACNGSSTTEHVTQTEEPEAKATVPPPTPA